jgi:hypothetical protein
MNGAVMRENVVTSESTSGENISEEAIREPLSRILESAMFIQSDRPSRFLRFTVEETLAGEADMLKEYLIGTEVYDRKPPYHPNAESIVRSEPRRLPALLLTSSSTPQKVEQVVADEQRFSAQLATREADLEQAKAMLQSNERAAEAERRSKAVLESQDLQLIADLHAKEAALAVARVNLGYTRIASPGDGSVGERQVRFAGQSRLSSGVGGAAANHWTYPGGTSPVKALLGTRLYGR